MSQVTGGRGQDDRASEAGDAELTADTPAPASPNVDQLSPPIPDDLTFRWLFRAVLMLTWRRLRRLVTRGPATVRQASRQLLTSVGITTRRRLIGTVVLLALLCAAGSVRLGLSLLRRDVLANSTYADALYNADAYDRVYTDVAGAPELSKGQFPLIGKTDPSYAIAQLRLLYPSDKLEATVEDLLGEFFAYINSEYDRIDVTLDARPMIDYLLDELQGVADIVSQRLGVVNVGTPTQFANTIQAFSADLKAGHLPFKLPAIKVPAEEAGLIANTLMDALQAAPTDPARAHLTVELEQGRTTDAAVELLGIYRTFISSPVDGVAPKTADLAAELTSLGNGLVTGAKQEVDRGPPIMVKIPAVRTLNVVRGLVHWFTPWTTRAADALALLCLAGLMWPYRRRRRHLIRAAGAYLTIAAVIVGGLFLAVFHNVPDRLVYPALTTLPPNLQYILQDVEWYIVQRVQSSVALEAFICFGLGLSLVALTYAHKLAHLAVAEGRKLQHRVAHVSLAVAASTMAVVTGVVFVPGAISAAAGSSLVCAGHSQLCSRKYDDVVFAGSHNSMSNAADGFVNPDQDYDIADQLDLGIRAFFLDTHYWENLSDKVGTAARLPPDLQGELSTALAKGLPPKPGVWLCHNLCSLGALNFTDTLRTINTWLDKHPTEVITLFLQDEVNREHPATGKTDTARAFKDSGLLSRVWTFNRHDGWPTLGKMIKTHHNLVVLAEVGGPQPDWYTHAFGVAMETPFANTKPSDLNCEPNRGGTDKTLFTLSEFLEKTAPSRSDAAVLNDYDFLLDRIDQCATARGHIPTFVESNFVNIGELIEAVNAENGF
jgi:hypothetical protein